MALSLPKATVTVRKGGLGIAQAGPTNVHVSVGCSSKGPLKQPLMFSGPKASAAVFGTGPNVKAAAYGTVRRAGAPYVMIRLPAVASAGTISDVTKPAGKTVALSGTHVWGYDVLVRIVAGGTVGSPGITYKVSTDGGVTFGATTPLGGGTTIAVDGKTITLTATESWTANQEISYQTTPAAQAIKTPVITRVGTSTCVVTATGTPEDEYEIVFEVLNGGTVGTVGIAFRYSLDGGNNWSDPLQLSTANTYTLMDGEESSGVVLNFAAGTLDIGDNVVTATTGPVFQASDFVEAMDALHASTHEWRFIHAVGEMTAAKAGSIAGKVSALEALGVFTYCVLTARDRTDGEIDALGKPSTFWEQRLITEYASFASDRCAIGAGRARVTCPITGRINRRPASWIAVSRLVEKTIQVDPGRKLDGALSEDVNIYDATGRLVELDSRISSSLHGEKFLTLRTYEKNPGVYITRGNVKSGPGSDFSRIALRAVMDIASEVFHGVMVEQIENNLLANPMTGVQPGGVSVTPGGIAEQDARVVDRELSTALTAVLVTNGYVSAVRGRVSRTDPFLLTGKLTAEVSITPLGYVDEFAGGIAFENPKFAALTA